MSEGSRRTVPLPPGWGGKNGTQQAVLIRDKRRCLWGMIDEDGAQPGQCSREATEVDHIGDPADHSFCNLRSLCKSHHQIRSSRQGGAVKRQRAELKKRPEDKHPGIIDNEETE
jgi:hypothetical protein